MVPNGAKTFRCSVQLRHKEKVYALCFVLTTILLVFEAYSVTRYVAVRENNAHNLKKKNVLSLPSSLFPREPKLSLGCTIKFQDLNMSLCYFIPYGANFGDELGPAAVKRILEYHFGCSSSEVHVINIASENPRKVRQNRTCLFALGSIFHYIQKGDHVWGTSINPTHQGGLKQHER